MLKELIDGRIKIYDGQATDSVDCVIARVLLVNDGMLKVNRIRSFSNNSLSS